jgi:hypothetical protein
VTRGLLTLGLLATLVFVPAAEAKTLKLKWVERTSPDYGYPQMTFKVKSVVVDGLKWSVSASVTNRSTETIRVTRGDKDASSYRFGLMTPNQGPCVPVNGWIASCRPGPPVLVGAQSTTPQFPATIKPGATWSGVFRGTGKLPSRQGINVVFGFFTSKSVPRGFAFITDHRFMI